MIPFEELPDSVKNLEEPIEIPEWLKNFRLQKTCDHKFRIIIGGFEISEQMAIQFQKDQRWMPWMPGDPNDYWNVLVEIDKAKTSRFIDADLQDLEQRKLELEKKLGLI